MFAEQPAKDISPRYQWLAPAAAPKMPLTCKRRLQLGLQGLLPLLPIAILQPAQAAPGAGERTAAVSECSRRWRCRCGMVAARGGTWAG